MTDELIQTYRNLPSYINEGEHVLKYKFKEFLTDYVSENCSHPKKITIKDKFTGEDRVILVPCGKCNNCRDNRIGDWCSRMILQTLYCSKYAYFVTLTYRSFDKFEDIPPVLRDAYFRLDDYNQYGRYCYSPCLLRIEHTQRFMKYLRKIHGDDYISFFDGSEYGSTFGRPHHHFVLWSNKPISRNDIVKAWSCRLPHSKQVIHIGRIDFNDLNTNGTIVADGINFGNDAHKCFKYVAKYVCKSFIDPNNDIDSKSRLNLFIDDVAHRRISCTNLNYVFNSRIRSLIDVYLNWADYYAEYAREREYAIHAAYDPFVKFNKKIYYDNETSSVSYALNFANSDLFSDEENRQIIENAYYSFRPCVLRKVFNAFCNSSRAKGIGMEYYYRHFEDYKQGKFNLPSYDGKKIVLPHLFVRKTKEYLYRYIQENHRIISKSSSSNLLINKDTFSRCFPVLQDVDFLAGTHDILSPETKDSFDDFIEKQVGHIYLPSFLPTNVQALLNTDYAIKDLLLGLKCLVYVDETGSIELRRYKYSRNLKQYIYHSTITFDRFISDLKTSFLNFSEYYKKLRNLSDLSLCQYDSMCHEIDVFIETFFPNDTFETLLYDAHCFLYEKLRNKFKQNEYKRIKKNLL